jgi:hypothetical protein
MQLSSNERLIKNMAFDFPYAANQEDSFRPHPSIFFWIPALSGFHQISNSIGSINTRY